jgi:hypothetical protein
MRALTLLLALLSSAAFATVNLEGTTDNLELITAGATVNLDYHCAWTNVTATALVTPGTSTANIATATTTSVIAAPAASNWRYVRSCNIENKNTIAVTLTVQIHRSAALIVLWNGTLASSEHLTLDSEGEFYVYLSSGAQKSEGGSSYSGRVLSMAKNATAVDTIGYHYAFLKDTGFPSAWTPGTPGVNGAATACNTAAGAVIAGSPLLNDPTSGGWYMTRWGLSAQVVGSYGLIDVLWYNTGLAVAIGAQAIVTPAWPARDVNGATNGETVQVAIFVNATLGNAAAIATSTITYVNSNGDTARTGTLAATVGFQMPATAVLGTWIPFTLQAGDTGVRSISSFNSGTTYTSGTFNLVAFRQLAFEGVTTANFPSGSLVSRQVLSPGVRIWNGTCLNYTMMGAPAVTAPAFTNSIFEIMEK